MGSSLQDAANGHKHNCLNPVCMLLIHILATKPAAGTTTVRVVGVRRRVEEICFSAHLVVIIVAVTTAAAAAVSIIIAAAAAAAVCRRHRRHHQLTDTKCTAPSLYEYHILCRRFAKPGIRYLFGLHRYTRACAHRRTHAHMHTYPPPTHPPTHAPIHQTTNPPIPNTHTNTYTCVRASCVRMNVCTPYICKRIHLSARMHTRMQTRTRACMHACMCAYIFTFVHACIDTDIHREQSSAPCVECREVFLVPKPILHLVLMGRLLIQEGIGPGCG